MLLDTADYGLYLWMDCMDCIAVDKPRDAFRGQSRSSNMVPFHMLGMVDGVDG